MVLVDAVSDAEGVQDEEDYFDCDYNWMLNWGSNLNQEENAYEDTEDYDHYRRLRQRGKMLLLQMTLVELRLNWE